MADGDRVFVAYIGDGGRSPKGHLYLIGAVVAASPVSLGVGRSRRGWLTDAEAAKALGTSDLWSASGHVVCKTGAASKAVFDREVPSALLPKMTFLVKDRGGWDHTSLKLEADGVLAQQTLRRVRRLHPKTAEDLVQVARPRK